MIDVSKVQKNNDGMVLGHRKHQITAPELAEDSVLRPTDFPLPGNGAFRGQPSTRTLILDELFLDKNTSDDCRMIITPCKNGHHQTVSHLSSTNSGFVGPEIKSHLIDAFQDASPYRDQSRPGMGLFPINRTGSRKLFWVMVLASIIIPTISADTPIVYVDVAVWAFGILANVPSIYVLANPHLSSSVDGRPEDTVWKVARGWSVSLGPVFALVLVMLLRTKLLIEKRKAFIVLLFVMTSLGILILMLFTRDGMWTVLDLLSICVSWCAVVSYMIVDGLRVITEVMTGYGGDVELTQRLQSQVHESAEDDHSRLEAGRVSTQSDGMFTIGDEST